MSRLFDHGLAAPSVPGMSIVRAPLVPATAKLAISQLATSSQRGAASKSRKIIW